MKIKTLLIVLTIISIVAGAITIVRAQNMGQSSLSSALTSDDNDGQILQNQAIITADQAKAIAEAEVGGTASNVVPDENGAAAYNVVIRDKKIRVSAQDGSILEINKSDGEQNDTEEIKSNQKQDDEDNAANNNVNSEIKDDNNIETND